MPVLGQTRILPQSLDATWEKLHAAAIARSQETPKLKKARAATRRR